MSGWAQRVAVLATLALVLGAGYASRVPATDDHAVVVPGQEIRVDVLANDTGLGSDLTLLRVSGGALGNAVVDGQQVRYTAFAGVSGSEQLTYHVRRGNGQVAAGRLFVSVEPLALPLILQGMVVDAHDTCDLAVIVGQVRYEACTTAGSYQVEVGTHDANAVVVVEATAQPLDVAGEYRYASVLGSVPRLLEMSRQAGTPGVLHFEQFGHLRLQEYTTMHHAQLVEKGGPGVFASEAALANVQQHIDSSRLQAQAVTFHALRRGWVALPDATPDPYAFGLDPATFEDFYATAMMPFTLEATEALANMPAIVVPWPAGPRIGLVLGSRGAAPGTINTMTVDGTQVVVGPQQHARAYHRFPARGSQARWELDSDGRIGIHEDEPRRETLNRTIVCQYGSQQFAFHFEYRYSNVTRLLHTAHSDVVLFKTEHRAMNYNDIPAGCTPLFPEVTYGHSVIQAFGRDQVLPMGGAHTAGRWATRLPVPGVGVLNGVDSESNAGIVDFGAGLVEAEDFASSMSVAHNQDNGLDVVLQPTQPGVAPIHVQYFRTRVDGRGGEQWLANADSEDDGSLGFGGLSVRETHRDLFTDPGEAVGAWRSSFAAVSEGRHMSLPRLLVFDVWPGSPGRGQSTELLENGHLAVKPFGWEIDDAGRLVMTSYVQGGQIVPECDAPCFIDRQRIWQPVALSEEGQGKRLYMIEELRYGTPDSEHPLVLHRRVNFFDETEPPGGPLVAPAPALAPAPRGRMH